MPNIFSKTIIFFTLILFLLLHTITLAQTNKTDSLVKIYQYATVDSIKIKAINDLFTEYRTTDEEKASYYLNLAISLGAKSNYKIGYALSLYNKGLFIGRKGDFDSSDYYINKSLSLYKGLNQKKGIANCYKAFGLNMYDKGNNKEALSLFLQALKYYETTNDQKGISSCYTWIGNVYNVGMQKPQQALDFYEKALAIQQKTNDIQGMSFSYNNIGNVNFYLKNYTLALANYIKSSNLKDKLGDKKGLSSSYNNIGSTYASMKQFDKAIEYLNKSLSIYESFDDQVGIISTYINIGNIHYEQFNYQDALNILEKALNASKDIGYKEGIREAAYALSNCYEEKGNHLKALEFYKISTQVNDSIINSDFNNQIIEMQTKYDVEKKDLEIAKNKAELEIKEKQGIIKNGIIISVLALLTLSAIATLLFFRKKKIEQQAKLDNEIALQKEIRTKSILEAEEKERRRIAQDLHDGVGQLLSAAKLNLSNLESKITIKDEEQKTAMQNALSLVDDSVKEVRAVSHNMMPNTLIKLGLASAIREFITKLGNAPSLKVDLEIVGLDSRLDNQIETVLYRVIQEVVNNIIKHANASVISMQIIKHDNELNVMIEDNGIGFDIKNIEDFEGIGLKGIQTRIEFLNGSVHFDSSIGRGTTVIIDIPVT